MTISVDNDFARFGAKSYAINKITSVEIREIRSDNWRAVAAIVTFFALGALPMAVALPPMIVFAIGLGVLAYLAWKRARRITYQLFLITTASEQQAYESVNRDDVYDLRGKVETAMMHHSRGPN